MEDSFIDRRDGAVDHEMRLLSGDSISELTEKRDWYCEVSLSW